MCTSKIQSSNNKGRKSNEAEASKVSNASKKQAKGFRQLLWRSYIGGHDGVAKAWLFGSLSQQLGCCTYNSVSLGTLQKLWVHFGTQICPHVHLQDPLHVEEHLLPIGEPESPAVLDDEDEVSRCEVMGMEEMLACAPAESSLESMNMFVQGFMPSGPNTGPLSIEAG